MITVVDDLPEGVLGFDVTGKLAAEDYTDVLLPALDEVTSRGGEVRAVLVLGPGFDGVEPSAVWQDLKLGIKDWASWERIALVTDHGWLRDGLRMFAWAMPGEVKTFGTDERDHAAAWAAGQ